MKHFKDWDKVYFHGYDVFVISSWTVISNLKNSNYYLIEWKDNWYIYQDSIPDRYIFNNLNDAQLNSIKEFKEYIKRHTDEISQEKIMVKEFEKLYKQMKYDQKNNSLKKNMDYIWYPYTPEWQNKKIIH